MSHENNVSCNFVKIVLTHSLLFKCQSGLVHQVQVICTSYTHGQKILNILALGESSSPID